MTLPSPTLADILAGHADALNAGRDTTDELVGRFGRLWPELDPMLQLAVALKQVLVPRPAPSLLERPAPDRLATSPQPIYVSESRTNWWFWVGALASLLAGGAGVLAWRRRRQPAADS